MKSKQVAITTVTRNDSSLTVEWENGESGLFHYMWLRDCCYCETCGDCHSSLRSYVPGLDTLNIRPQTVTWSADELNIVWEGSGHCSSYRSDWLNAHRYDDKARAVRRLEFTCWNAATAITPASFDFASVNTEPEARLILQKRLLTHGFVVVRNGPAERNGALAFAELCGEVTQSTYGAVFDLALANKAGTAGTTLRAIPPHSDEAFAYTPPGIEVLACIRPAEDGGDSIIVDGIGIAQKLRQQYPSDFDLLAKWNHHYVRFNPGKIDLRAQAPVIALDDDGEISGIRLHSRASAPLDLPESVMEDYLIAYHRLCALMMAPENQIRSCLEAGDAIIFDNHRVLHARGEFSDRQRFLQICGVTREKFHESFRLLAAQLGDTVSANLVLRAGVCR